YFISFLPFLCVVSTNGTAQIHCIIHSRTVASHLRPGQRLENLFSNLEDLQVALLRGLHGNQKICSSTLNTSEHQKEMQQEKDGDGRCAVQMKDGAVVVTLSGLKATHTDIYRCTIQVFYPPPYQQLTGNGTLLHVLGRSPQSENHLRTDRLPFISVVVVVLVIAIICVLIIIITLQVGAWRVFSPVQNLSIYSRVRDHNRPIAATAGTPSENVYNCLVQHKYTLICFNMH
uniref:Uncharacterized protein n=1 Tax=Poecilia reticulata TaxID=8081 RepID=A0A3P9PSP8_POERE